MDLRPSISSVMAAFGADAVVTLPNGDVVRTVAAWLPIRTDDRPVDQGYRRAEQVRVLAVPLEGLDQVPRGTVIVMPSQDGADDERWKVDETTDAQHDHHRVVVVPA